MASSCKLLRASSMLFTVSLFAMATNSADPNPLQIAVYWGQNGNEGTLADACSSGLYALRHGLLPQHLRQGPDPGTQPRRTLRPILRRLQSLQLRHHHVPVGRRQGAPLPRRRRWQLRPVLHNGRSERGHLSVGQLSGRKLVVPPSRPRRPGRHRLRHRDRRVGALRRAGHVPVPVQRAWQEEGVPDGGAAVPVPGRIAGAGTGLFDNVWVQFYNSPECEYPGGDLLGAWNTWTSSVRVSGGFYLGVPASAAAAGSGFVSPADLTSKVLPGVKAASNFGGIMVWDRYNDLVSGGYSAKLQGKLKGSSIGEGPIGSPPPVVGGGGPIRSPPPVVAGGTNSSSKKRIRTCRPTLSTSLPDVHSASRVTS